MKNTSIEWADIPGYEGMYQVGNHGQVKALTRTIKRKNCERKFKERLLTGTNAKGYIKVTLSNNGIKKWFIHRLVVITFIGEIPEGYTVNHKNGNKLDNHVSNLEIVTAFDNVQHAIKTGLRDGLSGESHTNAKLTNRQVVRIRRLYESGGFTHIQLAKMFGVSKSSIGNIVNRDSWTHL